MMINIGHLQAAIMLLDGIEKTMPDAFVYINATNEAKIAQQILNIMKEHSGVILRKVLFARVRHLIRNNREFDDLMCSLAEADLALRTTMGGESGYVLVSNVREIERMKEHNKKQMETMAL
jgi:hypothetical protein